MNEKIEQANALLMQGATDEQIRAAVCGASTVGSSFWLNVCIILFGLLITVLSLLMRR